MNTNSLIKEFEEAAEVLKDMSEMFKKELFKRKMLCWEMEIETIGVVNWYKSLNPKEREILDAYSKLFDVIKRDRNVRSLHI